MKQHLTQADEEKMIDFHVYQARKKLFAVNKKLKYFQITGIEITHSEQVMAPITTHWQLGRRFRNWWREQKMKNTNQKNKKA